MTLTLREEVIISLFKTQVIYAYLPFLLLLFAFLLFLNLRMLKKYLYQIEKKPWIVFFLIFFLGVVLRIYFSPKTDIYNSDGYFSESANVFTKQNPFYLYTMFIFSSIFGRDLINLIWLNVAFGALSIFGIFFLAHIIFKNKTVSLTAAFILATLPTHIFYSGTPVPEIMAMFLSIVTIAFAFISIEERSRTTYWLTYVLLLINILTKIDAVILIVVIASIRLVLAAKSLPSELDFTQISAILLGLPVFFNIVTAVKREVGEIAHIGMNEIMAIKCFLRAEHFLLLFIPLAFFIFKDRKSSNHKHSEAKKLMVILLWFVFSVVINLIHWAPLGRHYVVTYVPLILLFSYGLVKFAEFMRNKYGAVLACLLTVFIIVTPPLTILTAGEGWWDVHGNKLCMEKLRSSDAYIVKLVEPFTRDKHNALIVVKGSEAALLMFMYPEATIIDAEDSLGRLSGTAYNNIYFLEYLCDRPTYAISNTGKPIYPDINLCNRLTQFSKEIILRTKDLTGNSIALHRLEIQTDYFTGSNQVGLEDQQGTRIETCER